MVTCKDCIHFDACRNILELFAPKYKGKNMTFTKRCAKFKNKADFVEVGWIDVNDRLPIPNEKEENGYYMRAYLVAISDGFIMKTARWDGKWWILWGHGLVLENVTHWMPLPEPPTVNYESSKTARKQKNDFKE